MIMIPERECCLNQGWSPDSSDASDPIAIDALVEEGDCGSSRKQQAMDARHGAFHDPRHPGDRCVLRCRRSSRMPGMMAALLVLLLLAGCGSTAQLYTISNPDLPVGRARVAVVELVPNDLEAKHVRNLLRDSLQARGWGIASPDQRAEHLLLVDVMDTNYREVQSLPIPTWQTTMGSIGTTPIRLTTGQIQTVPVALSHRTRTLLLILVPASAIDSSEREARHAWVGMLSLERDAYRANPPGAVAVLLDKWGQIYEGRVLIPSRTHPVTGLPNAGPTAGLSKPHLRGPFSAGPRGGAAVGQTSGDSTGIRR